MWVFFRPSADKCATKYSPILGIKTAFPKTRHPTRTFHSKLIRRFTICFWMFLFPWRSDRKKAPDRQKSVRCSTRNNVHSRERLTARIGPSTSKYQTGSVWYRSKYRKTDSASNSPAPANTRNSCPYNDAGRETNSISREWFCTDTPPISVVSVWESTKSISDRRPLSPQRISRLISMLMEGQSECACIVRCSLWESLCPQIRGYWPAHLPKRYRRSQTAPVGSGLCPGARHRKRHPALFPAGATHCSAGKSLMSSFIAVADQHLFEIVGPSDMAYWITKNSSPHFNKWICPPV